MHGIGGSGVLDSQTRSVGLARSLRKRMTEAEVILWVKLRYRAVNGFHFRKQHPVGPYITDFACLKAHLIVEVDGATHSTDTELQHDRRRDHFLAQRGWRVLRVTNDDIYKHLDAVMDGIVLALEEA